MTKGRGEFAGLVSRTGPLAFVWIDRERRYFIASTSSLIDGQPYSRTRWRQVNESSIAQPEKVEFSVQQPEPAEIYYDVCGKIDQHNRHRPDTLGIEKKLVTHRWDHRENLSIFAMIVVDSWLVWSQCTSGELSQKEFYYELAKELIDSNFDSTRRHTRLNREAVESVANPLLNPRTGLLQSGIVIHLTPTKRKRVAKNGKLVSMQRRCTHCHKKVTTHCSECGTYCCDTRSGGHALGNMYRNIILKHNDQFWSHQYWYNVEFSY
mmetsp:Transcript_4815/g.5610  ORF Transcript_4815/g.5610 Transcript_4815/m.5610 type:complete len:265 (-) Transcript_4815:1764-2558(-)